MRKNDKKDRHTSEIIQKIPKIYIHLLINSIYLRADLIDSNHIVAISS